MTEEALLEQIILEVLQNMEASGQPASEHPATAAIPQKEAALPSSESQPGFWADAKMLTQLSRTTPARIGIWRAGPRLRTETMLRLRADHAKARDAVMTDVSAELLEKMGLFSVDSMCQDRNQHLTRPDLGRKLSEEALQTIKSRCMRSPTVQVYVSDGLSSTAVEAEIPDFLPALTFGLERHKIKMGTPFFLRLGRVPAMDAISEALDAEITCVLIGERPGLVTADSMSAYIVYRATVGMPESRRTVVSNIHSGGLAPVEAGAYVADVIHTMLERKASGVDLKL